MAPWKENNNCCPRFGPLQSSSGTKSALAKSLSELVMRRVTEGDAADKGTLVNFINKSSLARSEAKHIDVVVVVVLRSYSLECPHGFTD